MNLIEIINRTFKRLIWSNLPIMLTHKPPSRKITSLIADKAYLSQEIKSMIKKDVSNRPTMALGTKEEQTSCKINITKNK